MICVGPAAAVRLAEAQFPPPAEGVDMRLPGVNRFTAEAVQPLPHEKDQGGWAGLIYPTSVPFAIYPFTSRNSTMAPPQWNISCNVSETRTALRLLSPFDCFCGQSLHGLNTTVATMRNGLKELCERS